MKTIDEIDRVHDLEEGEMAVPGKVKFGLRKILGESLAKSGEVVGVTREIGSGGEDQLVAVVNDGRKWPVSGTGACILTRD